VAYKQAGPLGPQLHEGDLARVLATPLRFVRPGSRFLAHGEQEVHKLPRLVEPGMVAVEGDDTRSFLSIIRSLGRGGARCMAGGTTRVAPPCAPVTCPKRMACPPYDEHSEAWKAALIGLMEQEQFDLIYLPLYASFESEYLLCAKSW